MHGLMALCLALALGVNASSSVAYLSLIATPEGVQSELLPVEVDTLNSLYYRWSPSGRYLAFGRAGDLFTYDAQTEQTHSLTGTPGRWELMPSWSPDGQQIVFVSRPLAAEEGSPAKPGADPWTLKGCFCGSPTISHRDGTGYRVLEDVKTINPPSWSPDGTRLAYDADGEIHIFDLRTNAVTALRGEQLGIGGARRLAAPSWSPAKEELALFYWDGTEPPTREAILSGQPGGARQGYALVNLADHRGGILLDFEGHAVPRPPALWSSDGRSLAFVMKPELTITEPLGLFLYDFTEPRARRIAEAPYEAAWEPNGERLAYIDNASRQVRILSPAKRGWRTQRLRSNKSVEGIAWRPHR